MPKSINGLGTILQEGVQDLTNVSVQAYSTSSPKVSHAPFAGADPSGLPVTYDATIDINYPAIVLPAGTDLCNNTNFTNTLNTRSISSNGSSHEDKLVVSIPTSLTRSSNRCYNPGTNSGRGRVILGQPFLQVVYLMMPDQTGQIWLATAHDYDLPENPQLFHPNQTLRAAAAPPSPTAAASPVLSPNNRTLNGASKIRSIVGGTYIGGCFRTRSCGLDCFSSRSPPSNCMELSVQTSTNGTRDFWAENLRVRARFIIEGRGVAGGLVKNNRGRRSNVTGGGM